MPTFAADPAAPVQRKRWRVRVIAVVLIVLAGVIATSGVIVANKNTRSSVTAKQSLARLVTMMGDGVQTAGGAWTYEDESIAWLPGKAPGYSPVPCNGTSVGPQKYVFSLLGPGSPDPTAASARMSKYWVSRGHAVRTIYSHGPELENLTAISVGLADGAYLVYSVNNRVSSLQGAAVCLPASMFPPLG